ncbi:AAA family ATPase [Anaerosacchariphilus sp. NSJ-68]|uniref:AAA family ATPase n=2 Tax=Lachnospiraceae TaxID=186803 RepID=A0A923RNA7_9FIRM|nr:MULTISPECIES: ATP-binding protein [Lachnospiraceae]MBC5659200.1 AAA family ATPase [Anaerosacchariphilus hominis]MBC5696866.1 AAA family ATPase [Roseburia difficilis]
MNYTRILNQRLKKAGRDYRKGQETEKRELLFREIREVQEEAEETGSFLPWSEAAERLGWSREEEGLICVLWSVRGEELTRQEFERLYRELWEEELLTEELPAWYLPLPDGIGLSPVVTGWLEERLPELPEGVELRLPEEKRAYGLETLLKEGEGLFTLAGQQRESGPERLCLCIAGEPGSGRTFAMEEMARRQGMSLLLADGDTFRGTARELNTCVLCARLYDAFFCITLGEEQRKGLLRRTEACFSFYGIIRDRKRSLTEDQEAAVVTRILERPGRSLKLRMAEEVLGELTERLPEGLSRELLTGRQLPTGAFLQYLKTLRAELLLGTGEEKSRKLPEESGQLQLLKGRRTFEELKLPKAQHEKLQEICRMTAARGQVLEQWGFDRKFSYGNGISVLFYGAPGTGKTMAAQVMAASLGLPLYRVDLSQLISKYIGETQKNIGRIFEEADRQDCILLFDEADAVFTKRSDVSDAQDRYSNAETAYLLQRIEQYGGICILATNLLQNFDDAFRRRISYMVHFPLPDAGLRKELWESIFPEETPLGGDLDPGLLAGAFELSGASIKNAALHGALLAASRGEAVQMCHVMSGIRNEYGKQGKNFSTAQQELLDAFLYN